MTLEELERNAVAVLLKQSTKDLFALDALLVKTHSSINWPPMGQCVRRAIIVKDCLRRARKARTKTEQRYLRQHAKKVASCKFWF